MQKLQRSRLIRSSSRFFFRSIFQCLSLFRVCFNFIALSFISRLTVIWPWKIQRQDALYATCVKLTTTSKSWKVHERPPYTGRNNKYSSVVWPTIIEETAGNEILLGVLPALMVQWKTWKFMVCNTTILCMVSPGESRHFAILVNVHKLSRINGNLSCANKLLHLPPSVAFPLPVSSEFRHRGIYSPVARSFDLYRGSNEVRMKWTRGVDQRGV